MLSRATLPEILSFRLTTTSSPSIIADTVIPFKVPQSSPVMIISWATSIRRRVRYPASAVFKAVSAKPFLAPCVEIKYSKTVNPSRKFAVIGLSIISPEGLAMRPRIPANCLICNFEPLAPESAIIKTGLNTSISLKTKSDIFSVALVHISIILLYLSLSVITPF